MLTSSSCVPVALSTPVSMAPSRSFCAAPAALRRSVTIWSTIEFMNLTSAAIVAFCLRMRKSSNGSPRANIAVSSDRTIAST